MSGKSLVWLGMFVGSTVGGFIPFLWGGGLIAFSLWGGIGGIAGIWAAFVLGREMGAS